VRSDVLLSYPHASRIVAVARLSLVYVVVLSHPVVGRAPRVASRS